jgi:2-hydroxychromene-2-carboxylate isomerase
MDIARRIRSLAIRLITDPERRERRRARAERRRQRCGEPHVVHYFHQVDDPYSRLAAQGIAPLLARFDIELVFHPVASASPSAIHDPHLWSQWAAADTAAVAPYWRCGDRPARLRPPAGPADAAPLALAQALLCLSRPAQDQAQLAMVLGDALAQGDHEAIATLAHEASLPASDAVTARLRSGHALRHRLGHYLSGMFCYAGEWYWGLDRLHYLEARLTALGARRPDAPDGPSARIEAPAAPPPIPGRRLTLHFFPSLRSPYTHLSYDRINDLVRRYPLDLVVRPVLPMMMRGVKADRRKTTYILFDTRREAEALGIAFGHAWDPFGEPIRRAYSLFPWARDQGRAMAYLQAYSDAVWAQAVDAWDLRGLRRIVERAGLDWAGAEAVLDSRTWATEMEANVQAMIAAGSWGVPSFHLPSADGQPAFTLWGQDRIWRLEAEIATRLGRSPA